ncbi:MAG: ABC transporter ATP-binding protein [Thermoplasmata archaeon]|nr:ABC transporter ATP-binding protein [Candidatus Sysuiplasma acidicola]MBX8645561.1 ABC transporter ATP-binding protein [Candidatus Sysuiplasma acidicola]
MEKLVEVTDLRKIFGQSKSFLNRMGKRRHVEAVAGASFDIGTNEIVSVVGESGSGKTTLGRLMVRLLEPTSGEVRFHGKNIFDMSKTEMISFRRNVQMILQDPYDSLNPLFSVFASVSKPLNIFEKNLSRKDKEEKVAEHLESMGLKPAGQFMHKLPSELSGGQRQRVSIARAMILKPQFIVADEPVSMLDVSLRAEMLNRMKKLSRDGGTSFLFITHDISSAKFMGDRMLIFFRGRIVEQGKTADVIGKPKHPYTMLLVDSVPVPDPERASSFLTLDDAGGGAEESYSASGCRFASRCRFVMDRCRVAEPPMYDTGDGHGASCFLYE